MEGVEASTVNLKNLEQIAKNYEKKTDRERDLEQNATNSINKLQIRKNLTNPHQETVKYHSQTLDQTLSTNFKNEDKLKDTKQTIEIEISSKVRTYACDKCKSCDEFEPDQLKGIVCKNCKCELIHHLFDGDESPVDDDPEEWRDEDSEELGEDEEED